MPTSSETEHVAHESGASREDAHPSLGGRTCGDCVKVGEAQSIARASSSGERVARVIELLWDDHRLLSASRTNRDR